MPSVTKIENYAFGGSKLSTLVVENCEHIEEDAFIEEDVTMERKIKVQCVLNLNNVKNCKKEEKVVSDEQKTL